MSYPIPRASIWPNVVFDTSSAKGMADAQAWLASHVPVRPVEPREGQIDTRTHVDTQTATQGVIRKKVRAAEILNAAAEHARRADGTEEPICVICKSPIFAAQSFTFAGSGAPGSIWRHYACAQTNQTTEAK